MKRALLILLAAGTFCSFAHADEEAGDGKTAADTNWVKPKTADNSHFLSWEHTLITRTAKAKHAVAKLKIYNNWTPSRHRIMVKYNVLGLGAKTSWVSKQIGPSFSMPDFNPGRFLGKGADYHHGTLGLINRLDDDKVLAYSSEAGSYFQHPRTALMKRLRFDPWKKVAPDLSKQAPPSLTPEQRARLGSEVRALAKPFMKDVVRSFFRVIGQKRTFNVAGEKIEAQGYRLAVMFNAGDRYNGAKWFRVNLEWWLAANNPTDDVRTAFLQQDLADVHVLGGFTTSMWMNEMAPVMWQTLPKEVHQATATLFPEGLPWDGGRLQTAGVPVYVAMTVVPPKGEADFNDTGSIRVEIQLNRRNTNKLDLSVFDAPAQYKKESIEPMLKEYDEAVEGMQSAFDEQLKLSDASSATEGSGKPRYSWRALREYLNAVAMAR